MVKEDKALENVRYFKPNSSDAVMSPVIPLKMVESEL